MLASRRIRLLGEVPRTELAALYNMASAFVFPVEYEGFGLPVLEALACGCPTITTTGGSLPEVAGDAALLVPPGDRDALRNALIRLLTDEALRQTLGRRALERAQTFSATASAQRTLDILAAAARHQSPGASGDE
jgi:glycosyltransferase involved in cell wall biosynthesis